MSEWRAERRFHDLEDGTNHHWAVQSTETANGEKIEVLYGDWLTEDVARLIAAAVNSYRRHYGERALECAEGDLLGLALAALRWIASDGLSGDVDGLGAVLDQYITRARAVLAPPGAGQ